MNYLKCERVRLSLSAVDRKVSIMNPHKTQQPFVIRRLNIKSTEDDRSWGIFKRLPASSPQEHKQIKLVSRHHTRLEAREAMDQLKEEHRHVQEG